MSERFQVDLTPDPRVLRALTHTPLKTIDALCELIDNSLDSFSHARKQGRPINGALVLLTIPSRADLANGAGSVVIRDNGPGLEIQDAERALRAGFSGNNPFDTLGLFGMGFNIATGKLGTKTRFLTVHRDRIDESAVQIVVDLPAMEKVGHYNVPVERVKAPDGFGHGTLIEVTGWWPAGNPNRDFVSKLAAISKPKIREEIGRRYSSILRKGEVRILVNDQPCEPFEHCAWAAARSVERQSWGRIPARFDFDEVVGAQTRCGRCYSLLEGTEDCNSCGPGTSRRTIEERIRGWVGIQRYDDAEHFGIDLIRNGRAIRVLEKEAFFTFTDELGRRITDYPIDGPHGRIVGEVHLDHVPVDFMKQDFQRSSREWDSAMRYLRGESSLQPTQPNATSNISPIYKLYQGYRRVRKVGKRDLYPGRWDPSEEGGVRISREQEREMLRKFRDRVPGFYDDSEWWKLVEAADEAPLQGIKNCKCGAQVLDSDESCAVCGVILKGKECINCTQNLPASAQSCSSCGASQIPQVIEPWTCDICAARNPADEALCRVCQSPSGMTDPLKKESLETKSEPVDNMSIQALTVQLADESHSTPFELRARKLNSPLNSHGGTSLPIFCVSTSAQLSVYFDPNHEAFNSHGFDLPTAIAFEAARKIYDDRLALVSIARGTHSVPKIASQIIKKLGASEGDSNLSKQIRSFFEDIGEALNAANPSLIQAVATEMDEQTEQQVVAAVRASGRSLSDYSLMIADGSLVAFLPPSFLVRVFRENPEKFFDGKVFSEQLNTLTALSDATTAALRREAVQIYSSCLEDIANYLTLKRNSKALESRARNSLEFLTRSLA